MSDASAAPLPANAEQLRLALRRGMRVEQALPPRWLQAHVVMLPSALAGDFRDFCLRNPQACPLIAVSEPGQAMLPMLGDDLDLRSDLAAYQVFRDSLPVAVVGDVVEPWRRDLVSFVIAAASSCEQRLGPRGPVYSTRRASVPAGPFEGPLKVALRVIDPQQAIEATEASARLGEAHGRPLHLGDPAALGIADLSRPEQGEAVDPAQPGLPVFWGSPLTALAAARRAGADLCITNAPGALLATDLLHQALDDPSKR